MNEEQMEQAVQHLGPWIREAIKWAAENRMDLIMVGETISITGPNMPPEESRIYIKGLIPDKYKVLIMETMRAMTIDKIIKVCQATMAIAGPPEIDGHFVRINVHGMPLLEKVTPLWDILSEIIQADDFVQGYELCLNGNPIRSNSREISKDQPEPEKVKQTLESSQSIDDFLQSGLFGG